MSEPFDGFEHKVNVLLLHGLVGDNAAEEVGELSERLVADHDRALSHHAGFDGGSHLKKYIFGLVQLIQSMYVCMYRQSPVKSPDIKTL